MHSRLKETTPAPGSEYQARIRFHRPSGAPPRREDIAAPPVEGTCCLWSAGFIANRADLLSFLGAPPSLSDAELAALLYQKEGPAAAERICGPFAWILWDAEARRLVAVRDRIGIYGLYYHEEGETLWLAGAVEPLLAALPGRPPLNPEAVAAQVNGAVPRAGETFFQGVRALPAGTLLLASRRGVVRQTYWALRPQPLLCLRDDREYAAALEEVLFRVVSGYTAGEPVGVTVSGGMDSPSVAASLRLAVPEVPVRAFAWSAPEIPAADESAPAAAVCEALGLERTWIRADLHWPLCGADGMRTAPGTPFRLFYEEVWEATHRAVREAGLRVLFTGASGDHLFGGDVYSYPDLFLDGCWAELLRQMRAHQRAASLSPLLLIRGMLLGPLLRQGAAPRPSPVVPWLRPEWAARLEPPPAPLRGETLGQTLRLQLLRDPFLPHILEQSTRHAAAAGVSLRHPLFDHRLVEFAASLPATQAFHAGQRKTILRRVMRGRLPDTVLDFRGKIYPSAILARGLRERERPKVEALLAGMRAAEMGYVDGDRLRRAYEEYAAGKTNRSLFWHTLALEDWLRRHG